MPGVMLEAGEKLASSFPGSVEEVLSSAQACWPFLEQEVPLPLGSPVLCRVGSAGSQRPHVLEEGAPTRASPPIPSACLAAPLSGCRGRSEGLEDRLVQEPDMHHWEPESRSEGMSIQKGLVRLEIPASARLWC